MKSGRVLAVLAAAVVLWAAPALPADAQAEGSEGYRVVVHADHPGDAVTREVLAEVFLRRATRWGHGTPIHVVDQSLKSDVRRAFTEDVLHLSSMAVMSYWQQQLLAGGERPPAVKGSDAEVLEFVRSTPGAIGYVSAAADIENVKVLRVVD